MDKGQLSDALGQSNVSLASAVLHSSIVSRTDSLGNITFVNRNTEKASGYSAAELVGKTHRMLRSDIHPSSFWADMWQTVRQGNIWHGEVCNRAKDGSLYWVDTYIYPDRNSNGELIELLSVAHDITRYKRQEEALTRSQVHMRAIVNSTSDIYFLLSPDGKLLNINRAGQKNLTEYWDPRASENYEAALIKALNSTPESWDDIRTALTGKTVELEVELLRLDGKKIWHHVCHQPAYDDNNNIVGISIVLRNIHTRKVQELKLRESEIRYRSIVNSTSDAFFLVGSDSQLLAYNKLAQEILGGQTDPSEVEKTFRRLWNLQEGAPERLEQALKGQIVETEKVGTRYDGSKIWEFVRYSPAYDDNNNIIGAAICITDIQERKTQEILLQESRAHYRAILNSTSDIYFLVSPDLKLLAANSTGEDHLDSLVRKWKLPNQQAAFESIFRKQELVDDFFRRALAGEVIEAEHEVNRFDGSKVWYYHRYLPVFNEGREAIAVSISMTNIHTRKMQELEIESKNRLLTKIAWSHSHEMRRPVASILGLIQLRKSATPMITDEEFIYNLENMVNELDRFIRKNVERTYEASE